jgi:hypothetical protein
MVRALGCTRDSYFESGRDSGQKQKGPTGRNRRAAEPPPSNVGASVGVSGADACAGVSISARLRVELRRFVLLA